MNLRRARTLATVGTVACILSVSMLIAQTADGAVAEAVAKARRFIETPGRAQMILAAVHPFATYDDVRYVGPNSLQNGYFEVVYNFHWDDYGQTEIGFQC